MNNRQQVFWQSRRHFDVSAPWDHIEFAIYSVFDVVARPGWRLISSPQVFHELWLVRAGSVEIEQNDRIALAQAPAVALIRAGESRDTRQIGDEPLSIAGFAFAANVWGALDFIARLDLPSVLDSDSVAESPSRLESLLTQMVEEAGARQGGYALAIHGFGQLALVEMLRSQNENAMELVWPWPLKADQELLGALELVKARFAEPLNVEVMARAAHLSPKYFGRKFHAVFGLTPMDYLRRVRLNRARELLAVGERSVSQIATDCGFADAAHFSRVFKRHFALSPLELRREVGRKMRPYRRLMRPHSQKSATRAA